MSTENNTPAVETAEQQKIAIVIDTNVMIK